MTAFCLGHGESQNAAGRTRVRHELGRRGHASLVISLPTRLVDCERDRICDEIARQTSLNAGQPAAWRWGTQ